MYDMSMVSIVGRDEGGSTVDETSFEWFQSHFLLSNDAVIGGDGHLDVHVLSTFVKQVVLVTRFNILEHMFATSALGVANSVKTKMYKQQKK